MYIVKWESIPSSIRMKLSYEYFHNDRISFIDFLNAELKYYHGIYYYKQLWISFPNEGCYNLFLLKWL